MRAAGVVALFFLPSIPLILLCLVIAFRHRGAETRSYKVEAAIAFLIGAASVLWAWFWAAALSVAE